MITKFKKYSTGPVDVFDVNGKLLVSLSPECSISILPDDFFVFKNGGVEVFKTEWAGIKDYTTNTLLGSVAVDVMSALRNTYFFKSAVASPVSADNVSAGSTNQITTKDQITAIGIHGLTEKTPPLSVLDEIGIWDNVTNSNKKATLDTFKTVILSWIGTVMKYQGNWDASLNSPTLTNNDVSKASYIYRVSVAGTQFSINWKIGDWLVYNSSGVIEIADNSDVTRADLGLATTDTVTFANLSGNNTGDQDLSGLIPKLGSSVSGAIPFFTTTDGKTFGQSANATLDANGTINLGGATGTFGFNMKGTAASDAPTLGSELLTSSGWTSTGWNGSFSIGWVNTGGNISTLSNQLQAVIGNFYYIQYTISGNTTGSISISFGGQSQYGISSSGIYIPKSTTTGNLQVTPTSDFNGTLIISIKQIVDTIKPFITNYSYEDLAVNEIRSQRSLNSIFIGLSSGGYNFGQWNTFFGVSSGRNNSYGKQNSFYGTNSGQNSIGGDYNSFYGVNCGYNNTYGFSNTFYGNNAGLSNILGFQNTYNGTNCGFSISSGNLNSMFGYNSGRYIANGVTSLTIANNCCYFGSLAKASANSITNENVFGYSAVGIGNNTVMLGNSSIVTTATYGKIGSGVTAPTQRIHAHESTASTGCYIKVSNAASTSATGRGVIFGMDAGANGIINNQENGYLSISTNNIETLRLTSSNDIEIKQGKYFYHRQTFGVDTDGDWRTYSTPTQFITQLRVGGVWTTKSTVL